MSYRQQNQIDDYHSGRMTHEEALAFEKELASNASLRRESDFQSDLIKGLKEYRKAQLKARLETIDVVPSWIEFAQQSALLKSFGGIALATLVGAGVYFYSKPIEDPVINKVIVIDAPVYQDIDFTWGHGIVEGQKDRDQADDTKSPVFQEIGNEEAVTSSVFTKENVQITTNGNFTPVFNVPLAGLIDNEETPQVSGLEVLPEIILTEKSEEPVDVSTEISKNIQIKYKYYDGKLHLSGDFNKAPYEILEINSSNGRKIYIKYLDRYYKISVTDRLTELPEVKDQAIIEELNLLRQNK